MEKEILKAIEKQGHRLASLACGLTSFILFVTAMAADSVADHITPPSETRFSIMYLSAVCGGLIALGAAAYFASKYMELGIADSQQEHPKTDHPA